jgi:hypothetical protein
MTKAEQDAFLKGFEKAKQECIKIVDEWSKACHPRHPKTSSLKERCWQNHGLTAAKQSIKRDVKVIGFEELLR